MITIRVRWQYIVIVAFIAAFMALGSNSSAERRSQAAAAGASYHGLDPKAEVVTLPGDIKWSGNASDPMQSAILYGDPDELGLYIELTKWHAPNNNSRPHHHPNDRFITVISGTWWKGTGSNYDPAHMVPIPAGSFVVDKALGTHYDGAKDQDVVIEVVGMGPATNTSDAKK